MLAVGACMFLSIGALNGFVCVCLNGANYVEMLTLSISTYLTLLLQLLFLCSIKYIDKYNIIDSL